MVEVQLTHDSATETVFLWIRTRYRDHMGLTNIEVMAGRVQV